MSYPLVIQGGMGAGISSWVLANTVSKLGQLGVVSGTALDLIIARRLQMGDLGGDIRRALEHFPMPEIAQRIVDKYFIPGGKSAKEAFKSIQMFTINPGKSLLELNMVANFVEVFLAKEGHDKPVGINYLEKIQLHNLSAIYGAMLAGVDYILMGAGIPREIPGILDRLVNHLEVLMKIGVEGAKEIGDWKMVFDPKKIVQKTLPPLKRPKFLPIIASSILALTLFKKSTGKIDGFIIEGPTAGGHNAPPRGTLKLTGKGEPVYGEKDKVDLKKIEKLGLPFWLAGSYGSPEKVREARELGATGVQVGTLFAFCKESALAEEFKLRVLENVLEDRASVFTDPQASPTGFPFKVARLNGSYSENEEYKKRKRICDLGFLRHRYIKKDDELGYRCPAEPEENYIKKGGSLEETREKKCLCNALLSNLGLAQVQKDGYVEKPLLTAGDELVNLGHFIFDGDLIYTAEDALNYLLQEQPVAQAEQTTKSLTGSSQ